MAATCQRCGGRGRIITNPCRGCRGRGTVKKRDRISVHVPPG